jgi:ankyrin repeat protein
MPLHQAAFAGHDAIARLFVERGARLDIEDVHYHGTPGDWAAYAGHAALAEELGYSAS